jgi:hypothetical protein
MPFHFWGLQLDCREVKAGETSAAKALHHPEDHSTRRRLEIAERPPSSRLQLWKFTQSDIMAPECTGIS